MIHLNGKTFTRKGQPTTPTTAGTFEREAAQERARAAHLGWAVSQREYVP